MNEVADAVVPGVKLCPTLDKMCYHFERVDHSTVIIGWGEEIINGKTIKYWLVQNSWGESYGEDGVIKIARGVDHIGVESSTVTGEPCLEGRDC